MNLLGLIDRLEAQTIGIKGKTLFAQMLPVNAERAILLRSPLQGTHIDYELPGYFQTEFALIARSHDYADAETLINLAIASLTLVETTVGAQHFKYCRPRTEPVSFPLSPGNLVECTVMFDCAYTKVS